MHGESPIGHPIDHPPTDLSQLIKGLGKYFYTCITFTMPKYISPLNVIEGIEKCGMRTRLGGHQLARSTNHYTKLIMS
jgi:hypothetical protein